jgi:hypothetical protein
MTRYTVEWQPAAEDDLADIWMNAPDPDEVTHAQLEIDRRLANDPTFFGKHLGEGLWRIIHPPLIACYVIDDTARRVDVTDAFFLQ